MVVTAPSGGSAAALVVMNGHQHVNPATTASSTAIDRWWTEVSPYVTDLQSLLDDSRRAANSDDKPAMQAACQKLYDTAEIQLQEHAELTAEVRSVIEDSHQAAHMCLAYVNGSVMYDGGQFHSYLDEVRRHLGGGRSDRH